MVHFHKTLSLLFLAFALINSGCGILGKDQPGFQTPGIPEIKPYFEAISPITFEVLKGPREENQQPLPIFPVSVNRIDRIQFSGRHLALNLVDTSHREVDFTRYLVNRSRKLNILINFESNLRGADDIRNFNVKLRLLAGENSFDKDRKIRDNEFSVSETAMGEHHYQLFLSLTDIEVCGCLFSRSLNDAEIQSNLRCYEDRNMQGSITFSFETVDDQCQPFHKEIPLIFVE